LLHLQLQLILFALPEVRPLVLYRRQDDRHIFVTVTMMWWSDDVLSVPLPQLEKIKRNGKTTRTEDDNHNDNNDNDNDI